MVNRIEISESAVHDLVTSWDSPVGAYIAQVTSEVAEAARTMAPASPRGSKYAPPGYLKTRIAAVTDKHADDGAVRGLVGVPLHLGSRYPLPFIDNPSGRTRNRNGTFRRADNAFLLRALESVAGDNIMGPTEDLAGAAERLA